MTTSQRHADHRTCSHHEGAPAIAICTECGGDICAACHGSDLRGYCICSVCREKFAPPTTPWEDPNEDYSPRAFARTLVDVVTSPRTFFQNVRFSGSWGPAVAFGLLCLGVGLLFSTGWQMLFFEQYQELINTVAEQSGATFDMARVALFVAVPIRAVLIFMAHVGIFHLATRLAGGHSSFSLSARIVGYASAGYAFLLIPPIAEFPLGHFLSIIWVFNIEIGALRMYFRMGIWRAMFVVMATLMLLLPFGF
ncbi:hypothetical protein FIV42_22455 [Persicimonas caeni]|uniref:Yip1 domain-containing protein n=1 Tax=Persicimonas caeni TaxID=2292766 RepID=A0A4Y6PYJ7_PERCE|nr:YIP1 family protein [Persicimonas caeni]QDG53404.1 hypothetical protein FIV42_22455 [Persicimonas caeni]QED34625.1 hypothetical protein FRD00_22450 [Persicimonas caeni]